MIGNPLNEVLEDFLVYVNSLEFEDAPNYAKLRNHSHVGEMGNLVYWCPFFLFKYALKKHLKNVLNFFFNLDQEIVKVNII